MSNRQATKHVNILDYVIARLLREGVDDKAGEDDRDSAGDCTPSSEVSTCVTDEGAEDDDGVRRTVGDMTTEDSTRVTGDALGEVAKIPSTSIFSSLSSTASSRTSPSSTASSRSSLFSISVSFSTVASLKTSVSCSRSRRSSSAIALLELLKLKFVDIITRFLFSKWKK